MLNVAVADCPPTKQTLKLHSSQNPHHPGRVDFRAMFSGPRPRLFRWFFGDGTQQVSRALRLTAGADTTALPNTAQLSGEVLALIGKAQSAPVTRHYEMGQ